MDAPETKVAIIGMAGRFPGANALPAFWTDVLREGREAISHFDENDAPPESSPNEDAQWVNAYGHLEHSAWFDHSFFDFSPAEARRMDPQHRLFLECTWEALEDAATDITTFDGFASVYASSSENAYAQHVEEAHGTPNALQKYAIGLGNSRDFLATRIGYKLDLRGECLTVQSACSSSLGAVHLACQSILTGQSDLAIAGGVSVGAAMTADARTGYWSQEGFITSPDGHCRPFTEAANGTVPGEGVGVVILKPLLEALDDRDRIYGVISGSALNNDGDRKVGYQAPSLEGQVGVIRDALAFSDVTPHEIGYLECHGTGTDIGDAIELRALRNVFETDRARLMAPLYLGSVKANVGHLDAAAGVAGLIKATLALHHAERPPLVHADAYAPHAQLAESDVLAVNAEAEPWEAPAGPPRRAGITSLGIGGTNAHVLVEEPPTQHQPRRSPSERPASLLVWSAKTNAALGTMTNQLATALDTRDDELDVESVARTLQTGRAAFNRRRYLVSDDVADAADALHARRFEEALEAFQTSPRKIAFLFPGSGAYQSGMAAQLIDASPQLRQTLEDCAERLPARATISLLDLLAGTDTERVPDELGLQHRQCAIVSFEYALGRLLMDWGCRPDALMGSSLGEYTAACLSGALSLDDMLTLVWRRGELLNGVAGGGMTLVDASMAEVENRTAVADPVDDAIHVSDTSVVVSGPRDALDTLENELDDIRTTRLPPRVAYHSSAVDPIREDLTASVDSIPFDAPEIPYVSNKTGTWIKPDQLQSSAYWFEQMRHPVQLRGGFQTLYDDGVRLFLEVGPGHGLSKFVDLNFPDREDVLARPCLAHPRSDESDWTALSDAVGAAWLAGSAIDWEAFGRPAPSVRLPTYPFERRFFHVREEPPADIDRPPGGATEATAGDDRPADREAALTAPRTPFEETVADIWREVLGLDAVGVEEDFFDVGGDSFLALQLRQELSNAFDTDLPDQTFWERGTIAGMAREIERRLHEPTTTATDLLVQMNEGADVPPLLLLHPVGGDIFCYRALVDALPPDRPVYGVRSPGLVKNDSGPDRVEQMADAIASTVTDRLDPEQCRVAGWSFGGLLAYALAARLGDTGLEVSHLLMIDTEHPSLLRDEESEDRLLSVEGFARDLLGITGASSEQLETVEKTLDETEADPLKWLSKRMNEWRDDERAWSLDLLRDVYGVYRTNAAAYLHYLPEPHSFDGPATLAVAAEDAPTQEAPPALGWTPLLPDLKCVSLQADHYSIIQPPSVNALADLLAT